MGEYAQCVVGIDVAERDAEGLAEQLLAWLVDRGVVAAAQTDCVLGSDLGNPPGHRCGEVVETVGPEGVASLWTNGVDICAERAVYAFPGGGELLCPECHTQFEVHEELGEAINAWWERRTAVLSCPSCRHAMPIQDWDGPFPVGLGNLGVTFWNWPPLKPEFVAALGTRIGGRTRFVCGKL